MLLGIILILIGIYISILGLGGVKTEDKEIFIIFPGIIISIYGFIYKKE